VIEGVDVSDKQGAINWRAVASSGRSFAFIRVSDGAGHPDTRFAANWPAAKAAGLIRGVYQYFEPAENPIAQADLLLQRTGGVAIGDLPPTIDVETLGSTNSPAATADAVATWVDYVHRKTSLNPIVYASPSFWAQLPARGIERKAMLWVANWGVSKPTVPGAWNRWAFWQYSSAGSVPGITVPVDLDRFEGNSIDLRLITRGGMMKIAGVGVAGAGAAALVGLGAFLLIGSRKK